MMISRQVAGSVQTAAAQQLIGTSAFAFQGTNAHILLGSLPAEACGPRAHPAAAPKSACWQRTRFWLAPQPHVLLRSALWLKLELLAVFEASLASPAAAVLWQHQVSHCPATWHVRQACASTVSHDTCTGHAMQSLLLPAL